MPDSTGSIPDRVGFFGGSFDPIHLGHLRLAEEAIRFASLNLLLFCPAFHAPLRDEKPFFSSQQRLDMLYRITEHNPRMDVCRIELEKQKTCFTYETLLEVRSRFPDSELFLLLGADQFEQLEKWKFNHELAEICKFLVFSRSDKKVSPPPIKNLRYELMKNELIEISSTQIRDRLKNGKTIDQLVPPIINPMIQEYFNS